MKDIDVSVIVPIYNVELYLEECLDSLITQSLENIEIIAVNDGSTDNSQKILDSYEKKYPNLIRAYHKTNGGLSDARNFGISKSKGKYLGFVDSDDWVDKDMFKRMFKLAIKDSTSHSDIVICEGKKHFVSNGQISKTRPIKIRGKESDSGHNVASKPNLLFAGHSLACNKIFSAHLFIENKNKFPKGQLYEDSSLIYTLLFQANKISYIYEAFYHYRFNRPGAITNSISDKIFDIFKSCDSIIASYNHSNILNPELKLIVEKIVRNHLVARMNTLIKKPLRKNRNISVNFTKQYFNYMDKHFSGWKSRYNPKNKSISTACKRNKTIALIYFIIPEPIRKTIIFFIKSFKKVIKTKNNLISTYKKNRQKELLQNNGFKLLNSLDKTFKSISLNYFVDFGTLLGFVRENGFMSHDLDLDIGVFATDEEKLALYAVLQRSGYILYRNYILGNKIVEQSYHYTDKKKNIIIKFDINFYENTKNESKTWLFYYLKKNKLKPRYRHVVEMSYSRIEDISYINVQGNNIPVPSNYEKLLEEKYGQTWKTPDSNWIYWESPAAKKIDAKGYYTTKYNFPETKIRLLQLAQLKVLEELEQTLLKHNLTYYLAEGTMLGAVRHKGHIPWDDDIDIAMPRKDYDKLLLLSGNEFSSNIRIWSHTSDPKYHLPFIKIVSTTKTNFRNTFPDNIQEKFSGPRIDIFPLDNLPNPDSSKYTKMVKRMRILQTAMLIKAGYSVKKTLRNKILSKLVIFTSNNFLQKQIHLLATKNNHHDNMFVVNWFSAHGHIKHIVSSDVYSEPTMMTFENNLRPIPKRYDVLLKRLYGEYMVPPPINKRNNGSHFMIYDPFNKNNLRIK